MTEFENMVSVLIKSGDVLLKELTPEDVNVWHMGTGICTEAGEILTAVKKAIVYRRDIDLANVIEELGDLEFYMEGLRQAFDISRESVLEANVRKLRTRYAQFKYTDAAAIERKDKIDEK